MTATATTAKILEAKKYIAVDPINNNNKFWQYERFDQPITETDHKGVSQTGDLKFTWGRVGAEHPMQQIIPFNEKKLASKIREKTNKKPPEPSYVEFKGMSGTENMGTTPGKTVAKEQIKNIAVKEIASCPITTALVKKLAEANRHEIVAMSGGQMDVDLETGIVRTPLGVVTSDAVKSARTLLDKMLPFVTKSQTDNVTYINFLTEYLKLVPQKVGFKRGWHVDFIDINKQTQLLDQLEASVELAEQRVKDSIDAANKGEKVMPKTVFNVSLKVVDDPKVWEMVKNMYYQTRSHGHQCAHLKPVRVYEVNIPHMEAAFAADGRKVGNVKMLWHGTRMFNVLSIMKRGFVLPNQLSTAQTTGAMYGPGLYFSAMSTKSLNYSYGYWDGGRRDNNCYMFLVDVAMGKEYIPYGAGNGKKPGFDSCWAKPGRSGVINDEQIVYRTSQANIRYLVEFA